MRYFLFFTLFIILSGNQQIAKSQNHKICEVVIDGSDVKLLYKLNELLCRHKADTSFIILNSYATGYGTAFFGSKVNEDYVFYLIKEYRFLPRLIRVWRFFKRKPVNRYVVRKIKSPQLINIGKDYYSKELYLITDSMELTETGYYMNHNYAVYLISFMKSNCSRIGYIAVEQESKDPRYIWVNSIKNQTWK